MKHGSVRGDQGYRGLVARWESERDRQLRSPSLEAPRKLNSGPL